MSESRQNLSLELLRIKQEKARRDFYAYRKLINPKMKEGWFVRDVSEKVQQFVEDLSLGKRPILIIQAPPQHGKSVLVIDLVSWVAGKYPDQKAIFTSFSERLGIRANLRLQRVYDSEMYKAIFPKTRLNSTNSVTISGQYLRNREILEYVGHEGYFRNTTVRGSITGESLDIGIIDDPIKGRDEANSTTIRDKTWDWFTDDFLTRFSEYAGMLMILTRWHIDDPAGRLINTSPKNINVYKYRAIATEKEEYRDIGEPLFAEHKSLEFLLQRKKLLGIANFESLYQQSPIIEGGSIFKEENFGLYKGYDRYSRIVISWDTASKAAEINDPSVATVWGEHATGYHLLDVVRERLEYPALKKKAVWLAEKWASRVDLFSGHPLLTILIEDKSSGQSLIQDLKAHTKLNVVPIMPNNDKITRASTCSPQVDDGKVSLLVGAPWLDEYISEMTIFPNAKHDDQVDSTSQFLNWISISSGSFTNLFF